MADISSAHFDPIRHRRNHETWVEKFNAGLRATRTGSDKRIHPNRLIAELREPDLQPLEASDDAERKCRASGANEN